MKKIAFLLTYFITVQIVLAKLSINISPSVIQEDIRSGEKKSFEIKIQNFGSETLKLKSEVLSINMDYKGTFSFLKKTTKNSCASWLNVYPVQFDIKPNQLKIINIEVEVPSKIEGGYYAGLSFIPKSDVAVHSNIKLDVQAVVILAFISQYNAKKQAELSDLVIFNQPKSSLISIVFKNVGNIHLRPSGGVIIFNRDNIVIDRIPVPKNNFILPDSKRIFNITWSNDKKRKPNEIYRARCRFNVPGIAKTFMVEKEFSTFD